MLRDFFLSSRQFTPELQSAFARLSGDYNPLHMDPLAARRTLVGGQAVHGIHQVLSALEAISSIGRGWGEEHNSLIALAAEFHRSVLVNETIFFHLENLGPRSARVTGKLDGATVCQVELEFGILSNSAMSLPTSGPVQSAVELNFHQLAGQSGRLPLFLDRQLAEELFPQLTTNLSLPSLAEILALTRLVGMHCPGVHSLFSRASIRIADSRSSPAELCYQVTSTDERFNRVSIEVEGPSLKGQLSVFFRPPPELQATMQEVARAIKPGSLKDTVALIIGGSRGLGEVTAKLIASGGGIPIITYRQGADDAHRILEEIQAAGGACETFRLDVKEEPDAIDNLYRREGAPRTIYYFATPRIFGRRRGFFNHDVLREFQEIYVTAFGRLLDRVQTNCSTTLRVFYPSSIAVEEDLREMAEYAMAKRMGEELCAFYNRYSSRIEIIVERLPRIRTDQTATLLKLPAENGLDVMLPIIQRMESQITIT